MQHDIPLNVLGPAAKPMTDAVQACVHCGFCLPACPTYRVLGQEAHSPRGRILSMRHVLEGRLEPKAAAASIDTCLGCLACETACPSGVSYRDLISPYRTYAESKQRRSLMDKLKRALVLSTLPYPSRFRLAVRTGRLARPLKRLLPKALRPMIDLLPPSLPKAQPLPAFTPAVGEKRGRVALLAGCAQQVLAPQINLATIAVLAHNGVEVVIPQGQACCGALAWHVGAGDQARRQARINLQAFSKGAEDFDAIVTNAAGCGSGLHDYPVMFKAMPEEQTATAFASRVIDVSQYLFNLGLRAPLTFSQPRRVAYHDACHLSHSQGVRTAPRALLQAIEGLELLEIPDGETCCGSAGTYNLDQPEIASELGQQKASNIRSTKCDWVVAGNIGCLVQMQTHLQHSPTPPRVLHTMEVLALAQE